MSYMIVKTRFITSSQGRDKNLSRCLRNREICRLPRKIAKFYIFRDIPLNFSFTATNRAFSIIFASLFRDICIIIACATVVQVSLNSSHTIRQLVIKSGQIYTSVISLVELWLKSLQTNLIKFLCSWYFRMYRFLKHPTAKWHSPRNYREICDFISKLSQYL